MTTTAYIHLKTSGRTDIHDITEKVAAAVTDSGLSDGIAVVSCVGSTGAVTTIEYEPGLVSDMQEILQKLIPEGKGYRHDAAWGDDNGHSHLRSSLIGTSFTAPVTEGRLELGTWQQIVFLELDHRGRERKIVVKMIGE